MLKNYIVPFGFAAALAVVFEYLIFNPRNLWWIVGICFVIVVFAVITISRLLEKATPKQFVWYLVLPALFTGGMILGFSFLSSETFQHIFVGLAFLLFWMMFYSLVERHKWHKEVYLFLTIVTAFLLFFSMLNFLVLTGISATYFVVFALLCLLLFAQLLWYYKTLDLQNILLMFVGPLILFEVFWAFTFLPLSALIGTIVISVMFYLLAGISLDFARKTLSKRSFIEYSIVAASILVITLATATWFPVR